ncbi:RecQ family ATP-dependent DNA helicase [Cellulomonas sp. PhB143]|uniref:RecQ family ATP-dependent DNA helicase n=1 Tax=Cellulomonas sp. PhB143 TaxID=2485186 RepID=UPI000F9AEBCF|nr:RecQ family ATP-dependent DNA helicase [Cellulomonas sp. PhB143]ROS77230.1 ATP-dependent DNA helicase RecQ [Cellulomonas sp. PhB143]
MEPTSDRPTATHSPDAPHAPDAPNAPDAPDAPDARRSDAPAPEAPTEDAPLEEPWPEEDWPQEPPPEDGPPEDLHRAAAPPGAARRGTPAPLPDLPAPALVGAAISTDDLREDAETALRALVGREGVSLREDQWTAIEALVARHQRALVVERTGWGKSAVYFVATALLRARGAGPTVIVSPLLALMRDQVAAAARAGIRAVTINSSNTTEWESVHAAIAAGEVDVLLCSPERLNNPAFRDEVLPRLAADAGLVVVDEAHCISDWGHDFRPDYRRIRTLLADLPAGIPVLATTATANERVTADVAEQLGVSGGAATDVLVLRGALDRASLHLAVLALPDQPTRIAWLSETLQDVDGSGIVYCLTVSAAEQVASQLRGAGLAVQAYTGQTDPAEREQLEADLKDNRVKALVATSALGMGFDKPDLAFVVHLGAPSSPIAYYQQVGRAGRGVDQAVVVLLPGQEDQAIWDWFGSQAFPAEQQVRTTLEAMADGRTWSTAALETQVDLRRSRLESMLKVLDVDGAVRRVKGGWVSTGEPWVYDADRYARVAATREAEQRSMLDYVGTQGCRMAYLRGVLDDPELEPGWRCGRCDRCGGVGLPGAPDPEAVAAARADLDRVGVELVARRQWPSGLDSLGLDLRGRIPAGEQADPGRAVARLDGLGWSSALRALFDARDADGRPVDGQTPLPLRSAAARTLDEWPDLREPSAGSDAGAAGGDEPAQDHAQDQGTGSPVDADDAAAGPLRVAGLVAVRSTTRPQLVEHLATGLARYLGIPVVGTIGPIAGRDEPGRHDVNSATRLAGVVGRLGLELSDAAAAGLPGRAVLLVDDFTDSGWTLAVASRLLRQAGASAVHPFVLGVR